MRAGSLEGANLDPAAPLSDRGMGRQFLVLLGIVLAASLVFRWSLLDQRWINPDEGAHLMDGMLVLRGLIPEVDYGTRQPLYVYALAGALELFGKTLTAGRLLPLFCSVGTGFFIYLLGTELADRRVGLVAAVTYLLLPLEIFQSVVVKTEAPVTLLVVASIYLAVAGRRRGRDSLLVASGIAAGLGYYVRETALLLPLVIVAFCVLSDGGWRRTARSVGLFCVGYAGLVLLVVGFYAFYLSPAELLDLTPVGFVAGALGRSAVALPPSSGSDVLVDLQASGTAWQGYGEPLSLYAAYLDDAVRLHMFLFVGAAFAAFGLLRRSREPGGRGELVQRDRIALAISFVWLAALLLMYVYRYLTRGFFIDYFREFLPPLVLLLGLWLGRSVPALRDDRQIIKLVMVATPVAIAWFLVQAALPREFGLGHHATLATALMATSVAALQPTKGRPYFTVCFALAVVWIVASRQIWPSWFSGVVPSIVTMAFLFVVLAVRYRTAGDDVIRKTVGFAGFSLAAVTFALSVSYAAMRLDVRYEAVWPPDEAAWVATVIQENSDPGDEIVSGAVIWEFLADRRPYRLMSHPLGLKAQAPASTRERLAADLLENPPAIVVMDGYTEVTYGRNVPFLDSLIDRNYERIASSDDGFRPVSVFRRSSSRSGDP